MIEDIRNRIRRRLPPGWPRGEVRTSVVDIRITEAEFDAALSEAFEAGYRWARNSPRGSGIPEYHQSFSPYDEG